MERDLHSLSTKKPIISVENLCKHYVVFSRPEDRFKQMVVPRLERAMGRTPRRYFREFAALNNVSFSVGRGETVGIIGRNGSGKSTLLQIICGTLQPSSGVVAVKGRVAALLELGAGFNPEFTGRENVFLNAAILGVPRQEMEWRFDDIARFAAIGEFIDQPVKTYSSGMYVRLAFAVAINVDPDILIVDEALSVGDEAFQRKCFARIEQIRERGGTILFVSHGAQTVIQLCDRAILMDGGEKILEGAPKAVVVQYQRLVNASEHAAKEIRTQIRAMTRDVAEPAPASRVEAAAMVVEAFGQGAASPVAATKPAMGEEEGLADFYDPSLLSQSVVTLEERGARIRDADVATLKGDRVNVLRMGKRYIFRYTVEFTGAVEDVGFGMFIRAVDGLGLAGAQTINARTQRLPQAAAGEVANVEVEFSCGMLPGSYFITCGIFGTVGGESVVLHRVIDAVMIKVSPEAELIAVGRFDIGAQIRVETRRNGEEPAA